MEDVTEEQRANAIYNSILSLVVKPITKGKTTYENNILKFGKQFLKKEFSGVYASDTLPKLKSTSPYAVCNVDNSFQKGSHWLAVIRIGPNKILVYDSFGRKSSELVPNIVGNGMSIVDSDYDAEQQPDEVDCGARCLAYILMCKHWGVKLAKLV